MSMMAFKATFPATLIVVERQCAAQCGSALSIKGGIAVSAVVCLSDLDLLSSSPAFIGSLPPSKTMTGVTPAAFMTSTLLIQ